MNSDNRSIFDITRDIKEHPFLYFSGKLKFTDLYHLILGYSFHKIPSGNPPFEYFNIWIKKKFDKWGSTMHWTVAILQECNNDEEEAFWKFFELLDEFSQINPQKMWSTDLTEFQFAAYYALDNPKDARLANFSGRRIIHPAPYHIKIVQFDYAVHSYNFDFFYAVHDSFHGEHEQSFNNIDLCFQFHETKYKDMRWDEVPKDKVQSEFELITQHCNHRNALLNYMDSTNIGLGVK